MTERPAEPSAQEPSPSERALAVQRLFVKYQMHIRTFAIGLTGDFAAAEDVVQETFLTVTKKADTFRPGTSFLSWVFTIARLKVYESKRMKRRFSQQVIESLAASLPLTQDGPESVAVDRVSPLLECIEELAPKAREVLRLRYFAEHGPAEIATILGRTVAGVNATLVKARETLRECVSRKLAAEG
jgi:RNA polymerase sigma-70 factor (ECF subfamily)